MLIVNSNGKFFNVGEDAKLETYGVVAKVKNGEIIFPYSAIDYIFRGKTEKDEEEYAKTLNRQAEEEKEHLKKMRHMTPKEIMDEMCKI